ncbi:hypothetical protein BOX15_Mlig009326g2, partial [Macrostomum lignano]
FNLNAQPPQKMSLTPFEFPYWAWRNVSPPQSVSDAEQRVKEEMAKLTCGPVVLLVDYEYNLSDYMEEDDDGAIADGTPIPDRVIPKNTEIATNSYVLCVHSPVFRAMLNKSANFKEAAEARIELPGKLASTVRFVVKFLSTFFAEFSNETVAFNSSNVMPAMAFFKEYQMVSPLAKAVKFIRSECQRFHNYLNHQSVTPILESLLHYLRQAAEMRIDEVECLILCEIRVGFSSSNMLNSVEKVTSLGAYKRLDPITKSKVCAVCQKNLP